MSQTDSPISVSSEGGVQRSKRGRQKGQSTSVYLSFFKDGKCVVPGCGANFSDKLTASNAKRHLSLCHPELPVFDMSAHRLLAWYASTTSMPLSHVDNEYFKALLSQIPGFQPPSRRALGTSIGSEFSQLIDRVRTSAQKLDIVEEDEQECEEPVPVRSVFNFFGQDMRPKKQRSGRVLSRLQDEVEEYFDQLWEPGTPADPDKNGLDFCS